MVFESILGNISEARCPLPRQEQDAIELHWYECPRRALRKRTRQGRETVLLMPPGQVLRHGDILLDSEACRLVIEVVPAEVITIRPRSVAEFGLIAFEIGNLHVPAELTESEIRVAPDGPIAEIIERLGVPSEIEIRRFQPRFTAAGVTLSPLLNIVRGRSSAALIQDRA